MPNLQKRSMAQQAIELDFSAPDRQAGADKGRGDRAQQLSPLDDALMFSELGGQRG